MTKLILLRLTNFFFFYVGWGVCMQQATIGRPYDGPLFVLVILAIHLAISPNRLGELATIVSVTFVGGLSDTLYSALGLIEYASPYPFLPYYAPIWIVAVWALFAMCINGSLSWIARHWTLGIVFGFGGAFFSYYAGFKLGAATPLINEWLALLIISCFWAVFLPFSFLYGHWLYKKIGASIS